MRKKWAIEDEKVRRKVSVVKKVAKWNRDNRDNTYF